MTDASNPPDVFISSDALLAHWQGHRSLTRRVIEAFPAEKLFTFSVGGMRPFGELAMEMIRMGPPMVQGLVNDGWDQIPKVQARNRKALLHAWDVATDQINRLWPQIRPGRFQEKINAFGQYEGIGYDLMLYVIDNEIHHRGQGYVYLRALEIEPPAFYER